MSRIKKQKKQAPSRIRYEESHPTVSFRIDRELYDRLQAVKKAEGKSYTDVLKIGVGLLEVKAGKELEIRGRGFLDGHMKAKEKYLVSFKCSVCRETIEVTSDKTKEAIRRYLQEDGWGHADCVNRR